MGKKVPAKYLKLNKEGIKNKVLQSRKRYVPKLPSYFNKQYDVDELVEGGSKCYGLRPKENFQGTYIVYFYGSGMCMNITQEQWAFIHKLSQRTGAGLYVPMYPLAPEYSCRELFNMLTKAYSNFSKNFDVKKLILLGDGSGAGLVLSMSMLAWKEGYKKPDQMILLSPVLDSEFFDKELEEQLKAANGIDTSTFYNENVKDFLNTYWVKDYAVKTEYTSPFYEDYTDLCDDVITFSSTGDLYNCYAKAFYRKSKKQGINIRYYEFEGRGHNFIMDSGSKDGKLALDYLVDVINNTYYASIKDIYPIKRIADWSKKNPEIIKDDWAEKFIYDSKMDLTESKDKLNEYREYLMASRYIGCDEKVRKFIMKYPQCTIVNVGCRLDNMFTRLDNGRIQWYSVDTHNTMAVRRSIYGEMSREKTIGRNIMDFEWLEDICCNRSKGIMFMFNDALTTFKLIQIKELFEKIRNKFPGCELVFLASTADATFYNNVIKRNSIISRGKIMMSIDDLQKILFNWRPDYRIMSEEPLMKYRPSKKAKKLKTKIGISYNLTTYNHKLVHIKMGAEQYDIIT